MPFIRWNIGPDEIECEIEVSIHPGCNSSENGPGSPAWAELGDVMAIEDGKHRRLTDEEWKWLEKAESEIEEEALSEAE